jgi:hypothetical protein
MLNVFRPTRVAETARKSSRHSHCTIRRAQQQRPSIRRNHSPVERRYNLAAFNASKSE